jgi:hypothetical protein
MRIREVNVNNEKINQLVGLLMGLKPAEWSRIRIAVDKEFDSMSSKLRLNDAESLKGKILLELKF